MFAGGSSPAPDDAIVPAGEGAFKLHGVMMTPVGLQLPDDLKREQWDAIGETLFKVQQGLAWAIGDWLNYHAEWGDMQALADENNVPYETLRDYKKVAAGVKPVNRSPVLSFGHHRVVMSLDEGQQVRWLIEAEKHGWTIKEMKAAMRGDVEKPDAPRSYTSTLKGVEKAVMQNKRGQLTRAQRQQALDRIASLERWLNDARRQLED